MDIEAINASNTVKNALRISKYTKNPKGTKRMMFIKSELMMALVVAYSHVSMMLRNGMNEVTFSGLLLGSSVTSAMPISVITSPTYVR